MAKDSRDHRKTDDAEDTKREQDKGKPDPVNKPVEPEKAKTIDDLGIAANEPYPSKEG